MKHLLVIALATAAALSSAAARAADHVVLVDDNTFNPESLSICLGDTVTWQWVGNIGHSTTSGDGCSAENGAWDSGVLSMGATFTVPFDTIPPECATDESAGADTCSYFCIPHCAMMSGTITIASEVSAGLGLTVNKLRVSHDPTEGRGGTVKGVEMLEGALFADVAPGTTSVTLTLNAPGLGGPVSDTLALSSLRGDFSGSAAANPSDPVSILQAKIGVGRDPDVAKVLVKYQTDGFDLSSVGPVTLTLDIHHVVDADACGVQPVTATATGAVAL